MHFRYMDDFFETSLKPHMQKSTFLKLLELDYLNDVKISQDVAIHPIKMFKILHRLVKLLPELENRENSG